MAAAALALASVLACTAAHAVEEGGAASACAAATVPIAGARFSPRRIAEGIGWDARFIVEAGAAFDFHGGALPFAVPLPADERLIPAPGVAPIVVADRIVGLCVRPEAISGRTIAASFVQGGATSNRSIPLGAPIADSGSAQVVDTMLGETRLDLIGNDAIEKHLGYVAAHTISHGAREEAERLTGGQPRIDRSVAYLRAEDVRQGLAVRLVEPPARRSGAAASAFAVFGGLVGALVLAARKLRSRASAERADALLAAEIDTAAKKELV